MVYLLDTHILLWALADSKKLSTKAREILKNPQNQLRLSVISLIEISIKHQKGKLKLKVSEEQLTAEAQRFGVRLIPLLPGHASSFREQSMEHPDPFDKLLLATALQAPMYFLTADKKLHGFSELVIPV